MADREWFWFVAGSAQAFALAGVYILFHGDGSGHGLGLLTMGIMQGSVAIVFRPKGKNPAPKQEDRTDPLSGEREG